jgi:thiol-disulfide isomerase/thioredoxin
LRAMEPARASRDPARIQAANRAAHEAHARFVEAFRAADWDALDPVKDQDLLGRGLLSLIGEAVQTRRDGKEAVRLCEVYVAKLGATEGGKQVAAAVLPGAALVAGDVQRAIAIWEKTAAGDDPALRVNALMNLGDVRSAQGEYASAQAAWRTVVEAADQAVLETAQKGSSPGAPFVQAKPSAEMRLGLVGKAAPEIASRKWIGAEAQPLGAYAGKVVLLDLFATWCRPCFAALRGLEGLHRERRDAGLVVLGLAKPAPQGYLPRAGTKDPVNEVEEVRDLVATTFPAHLGVFRERFGLTYPVVVATEGDFLAYGARRLPTVVVIGRDGKVAFVKDTPGEDTLLRMAVDRLLATGVRDQ